MNPTLLIRCAGEKGAVDRFAAAGERGVEKFLCDAFLSLTDFNGVAVGAASEAEGGFGVLDNDAWIILLRLT